MAWEKSEPLSEGHDYLNGHADGFVFNRHFYARRSGAHEDIPGVTGWSKKTLCSIAEGFQNWAQSKKNRSREARWHKPSLLPLDMVETLLREKLAVQATLQNSCLNNITWSHLTSAPAWLSATVSPSNVLDTFLFCLALRHEVELTSTVVERRAFRPPLLAAKNSACPPSSSVVAPNTVRSLTRSPCARWTMVWPLRVLDGGVQGSLVLLVILGFTTETPKHTFWINSAHSLSTLWREQCSAVGDKKQRIAYLFAFTWRHRTYELCGVVITYQQPRNR